MIQRGALARLFPDELDRLIDFAVMVGQGENYDEFIIPTRGSGWPYSIWETPLAHEHNIAGGTNAFLGHT